MGLGSGRSWGAVAGVALVESSEHVGYHEHNQYSAKPDACTSAEAPAADMHIRVLLDLRRLLHGKTVNTSATLYSVFEASC